MGIGEEISPGESTSTCIRRLASDLPLDSRRACRQRPGGEGQHDRMLCSALTPRDRGEKCSTRA